MFYSKATSVILFYENFTEKNFITSILKHFFAAYSNAIEYNETPFPTISDIPILYFDRI